MEHIWKSVLCIQYHLWVIPNNSMRVKNSWNEVNTLFYLAKNAGIHFLRVKDIYLQKSWKNSFQRWKSPDKMSYNTLFESENERQKIEPAPIQLLTASRNFPDVKTRNEKKNHNWTSEIIPFIHFGIQMDGT